MAATDRLLSILSPGAIRRPTLVAAAAEAPRAGGRNGVDYQEIPCQSALNRCSSDRMPFDWTINPYRGCEFACRYCYARYTHEYIGLPDPHSFETQIFAKTSAAAALARELPPGRKLAGGIAIGTATDPYQPAERTFRITRGLLEVFARREGLKLSITTKSDLVTRDLDLLTEIHRRHRLTVNLTITTTNRRLARLIEPRAPRPLRRFEAVRALSSAGIMTGVFIMPILPGITDSASSLESIVAASARVGATYVAHQVLFLRSSAKSEFYPFLAQNFPKLAPRYRRVYGGAAYHTPDYRERVKELMAGLRRRHGLASRPMDHDAGVASEEGAGGVQMALGF
ncbi:MAG: radical SAM protein [Acidobacteria bacterium]|nr:radical SAM protein [Acidobacteriota bacterium]